MVDTQIAKILLDITKEVTFAMSTGDQKFLNPFSGELLVHRQRKDGARVLFTITEEHSGSTKGEAVIGPSGNPRYVRDLGGRVICDDSK